MIGVGRCGIYTQWNTTKPLKKDEKNTNNL